MVEDFKRTHAYRTIFKFITKVNMSVMRTQQKYDGDLIKFLDVLDTEIKKIQLCSSPQRYGNKAARVFFEFIKNVKTLSFGQSEEIIRYFISSFGNSIRLDYGTGHELNFFCYLYCLYTENYISLEEIFPILKKYFQIVRNFIFKFNLEPAGSHGIWGIDDYQLLPFLFGSSEIIQLNRIKIRRSFEMKEELKNQEKNEDFEKIKKQEISNNFYKNIENFELNELGEAKSNNFYKSRRKIEMNAEDTNNTTNNNNTTNTNNNTTNNNTNNTNKNYTESKTHYISEITFEDIFSCPEYSNTAYSQSLHFIHKHKTRSTYRPFQEHSPVLYRLREKSWDAINKGMLSMYDHEVLGAKVVTQHFIFSKYLKEDCYDFE
ncbi:serine/threonine-protein phosphatase 2A activator [Hamiltosporidium tvaerminnensis]|uniref:Serine/threonine-protein phosphatase 2A activator n=1 Tax=Hamiltosporidium tvaerminnensis TaxID=1176355 RepID=A0A4Q9KUS6_9MICR|nr:Serine/threonine-protein phosphatase 2A activator [Hamiltosporidium tvaerminnensis]TBT97749.1 serine/threonine-protein phosphatase 2A activator [Hamiltosporidium tvaerminnensis]